MLIFLHWQSEGLQGLLGEVGCVGTWAKIRQATRRGKSWIFVFLLSDRGGEIYALVFLIQKGGLSDLY